MVWEAILMRFPVGVAVENLPKDWQPPSLGTEAEIQSLLRTAFSDGEHIECRSTIKGDGFTVEFYYDASESSDELVRSVSVQLKGSIDGVPLLQSATRILDGQLLDLQTGVLTDAGPQTEASITDLIELNRRIQKERRWVFGFSVVFIAMLHALQDSGMVPAAKSLSKPSTAVYGLVGLIALNFLVFSSTVISAMWQLRQFNESDRSPQEREVAEEAILAPAFQGDRPPTPLIARFLHIPVAGFCGMIVGSIVAWGVSIVIF